MPAIDVQINPTGAASASIAISIINRAGINIAPQDITVLPSFDAGDFYVSNAGQSPDDLKTTLSLISMGTIAPNGVGKMKTTLSGVTDGKNDPFIRGVELQFVVRIRMADDHAPVQTFDLIRTARPP